MKSEPIIVEEFNYGQSGITAKLDEFIKDITRITIKVRYVKASKEVK